LPALSPTQLPTPTTVQNVTDDTPDNSVLAFLGRFSPLGFIPIGCALFFAGFALRKMSFNR
jgi:hypothetical protein